MLLVRIRPAVSLAKSKKAAGPSCWAIVVRARSSSCECDGTVPSGDCLSSAKTARKSLPAGQQNACQEHRAPIGWAGGLQ